MTQIAPLGFEIDTAALLKGGQAADKLAVALDKAATATDRLDTTSAEAAAEVKKVAEAEKQAAISAEQFGKAVVDAVAALTKEKAAADAAAKALRDKELADKKAADAARKAAEEEARRANAFNRISDSLKGISGAAANSNQHVESLSGHLARMAQTVQAGPGGLSGGLSSSAGMIARFAGSLGPLGGIVAGAVGGVLALGGAYVGLNAAVANSQDRFALLEARLKNVYGSSTAAKRVFQEITVLADKNAISIEGTADAFLRLARNNEAIGLTRKQTVELTDAVQMLGRVSGASTGELSAGMLQFSQALASGRLNGDELRSIMENLPALAKAIAQGMGVSVGQIRAMGAAGELTGDKITKALLGQLPQIQKEFAGLPITTEQAFTRVANAWETMLSNMGQKLNSSKLMQSFAGGVEDVINSINNNFRVETPAEARRRIIGETRSSVNFPVREYSDKQADAMLYDLMEKERFSGMLDQSANSKELRDKMRAPYVSSQRVTEELDPARKRVQEIKSNIASLEAVIENFRRAPSLFEPQEVENISRYAGYIGQLKKQLEDALPAFDKFKKATSDRVADAIKYGYQGEAFGGKVRRLTGTVDANGRTVSESAAVGVVTQDSIISVNAQTAAINAQIEAEKKRAAAIGQGKAAEREAEASAKALTYQLETFGNVVNDGVVASVGAYKSALLGLASAQDAAAQKQSMLTAQMDLASAKAGAGALAAGGGQWCRVRSPACRPARR